MSNIQEAYLDEIKDEFVDKVKVYIREKLSHKKSFKEIAKHLKVHLYTILSKTRDQDLLDEDQKAELVNKAYKKIYPVLEARATEEAPRPSLKAKFFSRPSFLKGFLSKTRKAKSVARAPGSANVNMATRSNSRNMTMNAKNKFNMGSIMKALNNI